MDETSCWTGFQDGPCAEWWPDGRKRPEGTCHNGVLAGWFREWDSEGRLIEESLHDERSTSPPGHVTHAPGVSWFLTTAR